MRTTPILEAIAAIAKKPLATASKENRSAFSGLKEHILIVDDEHMIVQTGKEMLESLGYRVTTRTNSREALETVRQQPEIFDLVITDFVMPQMNGLELARELMQLRPDLPIILFTGFSKAISADNAREMGLADYLIKPVRVAELHQAVRRALDAKVAGTEAIGG